MIIQALNQIEESLGIMLLEAVNHQGLSDPLTLKIGNALRAVRELNRCDGCGHHRLSCICPDDFAPEVPDAEDPNLR